MTHSIENILQEILEMFYREYEDSCMPVLTAYAQGTISIEEQIRQTERLWNKAMKKAEQELINYFKGLIPEEKTTHLKKCYTAQFKCLCGHDGYNACRSQILQSLEEK